VFITESNYRFKQYKQIIGLAPGSLLALISRTDTLLTSLASTQKPILSVTSLGFYFGRYLYKLTKNTSFCVPFSIIGKGIDVFHHQKNVKLSRHGGTWGERRYNSYSYLTSALDRGEWSASRPGSALPPGKDPQYPLDRRLGGLQSRSGRRGQKKNPLPLPGIEPRSSSP
jgi:hypothetical protein